MSGPASKWLEPGPLLGIASFAAMVWTGYYHFADTTSERIQTLSERIRALEVQMERVARLEDDLRAIDREKH